MALPPNSKPEGPPTRRTESRNAEMPPKPQCPKPQGHPNRKQPVAEAENSRMSRRTESRNANASPNVNRPNAPRAAMQMPT